MSKLSFLTSSVSAVARSIHSEIGRKNQKLAFINTAAEAEEGDLSWLEESRISLIDAGFDVTEYTITGKVRDQVLADLQNYDMLFFSGGNQFYLLETIEESGSAPIIRELVNSGKIYIGESAGSIIAGPDIYSTYYEEDVKKAPKLKSYTGLGLVDFIVFPHWGSDYFRNKYLNFRMNHAYTEKDKIILLTDFQYITVREDCIKINEVKQSSD